jgi:uncharacterized FlaG/YvyC family protein
MASQEALLEQISFLNERIEFLLKQNKEAKELLKELQEVLEKTKPDVKFEYSYTANEM